MLQAGSPTNVSTWPGQLTSVLANREQVGQRLAGVELVGERVHDGYAGVLRHLLEPRLRMGPPHDERRLPTEHAGRVGDGLPDADLRE